MRQDFSVVLEPVLELALVDQAGLKLRDSPASSSRVLALKLCVTPPSPSQDSVEPKYVLLLAAMEGVAVAEVPFTEHFMSASHCGHTVYPSHHPCSAVWKHMIFFDLRMTLE